MNTGALPFHIKQAEAVDEEVLRGYIHRTVKVDMINHQVKKL